MTFTKLVPNVFYTDIQMGLRLFVDCLQFKIGHDELNSDNPFCTINKDGLSLLLFQNREYAEKDRPELRLQTNDIEAAYNQISTTHPEFLHPNLRAVTLRPWGAKEFALKDESNVCIIIQQW
jgi:hypothetical protein